MYNSYQNVDKEISERLLKVQAIWFQVQWQVRFLKHIHTVLDKEFRMVQDRILGQLVDKLKAAMSEVQKLEKRQGRTDPDQKATKDTQYNKWKYPLIKKGLDAAIGELKEWQGHFDPSWFHTMRISHNLIDTGLKRRLSVTASGWIHKRGSMLLKAGETSDYVYTAIPYSTASLCQRSSKPLLIADPVPVTPGIALDIQNRDVRDLAHKLKDTDPISLCLLKCRGVARVVRFRLAQQLARSLSYVHMYEFVHKGIRPETVLNFDSSKTKLAHSFLFGFEKFRADAGRTSKFSDSAWERDLHRHPQRQGLAPGEAYKMQHDIYSLGVCLLEIRMWRTLVTYDSTKKAISSQLLPPPGYSKKNEVTKATPLKDTLVGIAQRELPSCMGDK
ncbi:hypothetical protein BKA58DRAFT_403237 [Alternaria rosae]|uniref:uncharacterized protein n=1 Tax=Alternaria rosae TaxID=1187941 RepID=UPI001E8DFD5F|nr:uncharacterized protein BKA58DRAFT_403237 [Alternaria rosae]KAH6866344.1 hypothetical protein BKA58DRAFT_403237 [Alternaria rosae]